MQSGQKNHLALLSDDVRDIRLLPCLTLEEAVNLAHTSKANSKIASFKYLETLGLLFDFKKKSITRQNLMNLLKISGLVAKNIYEQNNSKMGRLFSFLTSQKIDNSIYTRFNLAGHIIIKIFANSYGIKNRISPIFNATYCKGIRITSRKDYKLKMNADGFSNFRAMLLANGTDTEMSSALKAFLPQTNEVQDELSKRDLDKIRALQNKGLQLTDDEILDALTDADMAINKTALHTRVLTFQNSTAGPVKKLIRILDQKIETSIIEVSNKDPQIALTIWEMSQFKDFLPSYQMEPRPKKNFLVRCLAALFYGCVNLVLSVPLALFSLLSLGFYLTYALIKPPLNFLVNLVFNRKKLGPSLANNLVFAAKTLVSTVILIVITPLTIGSNFIKGLKGGYYFANLKNAPQIIGSIMNFRFNFKTLADIVKEVKASMPPPPPPPGSSAGESTGNDFNGHTRAIIQELTPGELPVVYTVGEIAPVEEGYDGSGWSPSLLRTIPANPNSEIQNETSSRAAQLSADDVLESGDRVKGRAPS